MTWKIVLTNSKNKKITAWKKNGIKCKFIGIIAHRSKFCIFSFMNGGEITHFLKINSAILEFKMSRMDKVLWKLVET